MATTQRLGIDIVATDKTRGAFSSVQRQFNEMSRAATMMKGMLGGALAALTAGSVGNALKSQIDHMDELGKSAQKIGIPVDMLSQLEYAAKLSDVSLDQLETTMSRFSKSLAEIQGGGKNDAGAALQALGIKATTANGQLRPTTVILGDVAAQMSLYRDGANKTAIAMALFGKSGADMIPMLNGGRQAINGAMQEAQNFGLVVSTQSAAAAEHFNDNLTKLQGASQGFAQSLVVATLPALNELSDIMVTAATSSDSLTEGTSFAKQAMQELARFSYDVSQAIFEVSTVYGVLRDNWQNSDGLSAALNRWDAAFSSIGQHADQMKEKINALTDPTGSIASIANNFGQRSAPGKGDLQSPAPEIISTDNGSGGDSALKKQFDEATSAAERLKAEGQAVWEQTRSPLEKYQLEMRNLNDLQEAGVIDHQTYGRAVQDLQDDFAKVTPEVNALADAIGGQLSSAFSNWIGEAVDGTFSLKSAQSDLAKSMGSMFIQQGMQGLFSGSGPGGGFLSSLFGSLGSFGGLYADGGRLGAGKWGIAGEMGPEIIHGPASVTPMDRIGGGQAVTVHVSLSDDLRAEVDNKVQNGTRQAVQVSVAESGRQAKRNFGANYGAFSVRQR